MWEASNSKTTKSEEKEKALNEKKKTSSLKTPTIGPEGPSWDTGIRRAWRRGRYAEERQSDALIRTLVGSECISKGTEV